MRGRVRNAARERAVNRGLNFEEFRNLLASPPCPPSESWQPWIVRLSLGEFDEFAAVCRERQLRLVDTIERQLMDLAVVRHPGGDDVVRARFVANSIAERGGSNIYGRWVYLPWDAKVVHLLGPDEYFEVITNRNQNKITPREQRLLREKRIGVVGLSVGGEAAFTVAQEHLCGEIVLADFDRLDLSNLNRLGAGVGDLGERKAALVARRIASVDPYLGVRLYPDGVTEENLDAFLDGLDLLIEECDGLGIKHELRRRAKARGLDVVFAADERGFLSIEPYSSWPELPPFHGRIEGPQPPREAFPSPLAFMRALTEWMGGWDAISERSRSSLEQLGARTCGYPQLASEARFAAGQLGHVARRLLLGDPLPPYIGHMDLDLLLVPRTKEESLQ